MFEELKQQGGMSVKERTRLFLSVSLLLVLGAAVLGGRACSGVEAPRAGPPPSPPVPPSRPLDLGPLAGLRDAGGVAPAIDAKALDHVLSELRSEAVSLVTRAPRTPAEVVAMPPKEAVGRPVEVRGRARQLDSEPFESSLKSLDTLWSFAVEGEDGTRVVVVHAGSSTTPAAGKPKDAYLVGGFASASPLAEGDVVLVRGVYLQQKSTGAVGQIALGGPTPIVVGREYRRLPSDADHAPPASLADVDWAGVEDRTVSQTMSLEIPQHFQTLAWARARGHEAIARDLKSGAMPVVVYDRDTFRRWNEELERDDRELRRDAEIEDQRRWTNSVRGKVVALTGGFGYFDEEGWATVVPNEHGIQDRWSFWLESDHHHRFASLRMHSPWPLSAFPGVRGVKGERVRAYGVFVKNYSFVPQGRPEGDFMTIPYFVLLHLEPWEPIARGNMWRNVFWYASLALLVLGILFYLVLIRGERKESATMEGRRIALRKRIRAKEGLPGAPRRSPTAGEAPSAGAPPPGGPDGEPGS